MLETLLQQHIKTGSSCLEGIFKIKQLGGESRTGDFKKTNTQRLIPPGPQNILFCRLILVQVINHQCLKRDALTSETGSAQPILVPGQETLSNTEAAAAAARCPCLCLSGFVVSRAPLASALRVGTRWNKEVGLTVERALPC